MELIKKHPKLFMIILIVILFLCFFVAINVGSIQVSFLELFKGLFVEYNENVASIYSIRFPRIIIAMLVGGALALSGLLFQVVLKNPKNPEIVDWYDGSPESFDSIVRSPGLYLLDFGSILNDSDSNEIREKIGELFKR